MTDSEGETAELERRIASFIAKEGAVQVSSLSSWLGISEQQLRLGVRHSKGLKLLSDGLVDFVPEGEIKQIPPKTKHRRPVAKPSSGALRVSMQRREIEEGEGVVGYLCIGDEFDLEEMRKYYERQKLFTKLAYDVLHVSPTNPAAQLNTGRQSSDGAPATYGTAGSASSNVNQFDLFIFEYGVIVWWGYDQRHYGIVENDFVIPTSKINKWIMNRYKATLIAANFPVWCRFSPDFRETELKGYEPGKRFEEKLQYDHFLIPHDSRDVKLCISHALAQSAKIDYLEIKIEELTQNCKPLPRELKDKGSVTISERKLLQLRGEVLFYRLMLKSGSDLLDEPELFWEHPWLKPFYTITKEYFEISERVETLDGKLDADNQILGMISDQFNQRHGSRLEWIVIWLVMVEVLIGILELVLDVKPWAK